MKLPSAWLPCVCALCIGCTSMGSCSVAARQIARHGTHEGARGGTAADNHTHAQTLQASSSKSGSILLQASLRRSSRTDSVLTQLPLAPEHVHVPPAVAASEGGVVEPGTAPVWEPEVATLPQLDDNMLSSPALLAYMVTNAASKASTKLAGAHKHALTTWVGQNWGCLITGMLFFVWGGLILWFNELRSVKMDTLLSRGINECESIDPSKATDESLGCLVHVVGHTAGASPVEDPQFTGVSVANCLKLQSTIEVYEWVQTVKIAQTATQTGRQMQDKKNNISYTFHKEWSTIHRNSLQFQRSAGKPSPDNPRPPRGLNLGTFTSVCKNVKLGNFTLPEDMVEQFKNFEPAMRYLPPTVQACGLMFYANKDGYFYSRPSMRSMWSTKAGPSIEPVVGDLRVRFLCVPQSVATVVAVHCEKDGVNTFVPYRPIPRGCCSNETQDRQRLIEEGTRSIDELKAGEEDMAPCMETNRMAVGCFCCPCNTIQRVCSKEVVTEEIYYIAEERAPLEKPFEWVVPRSAWRVWIFRAIGWLMCYLSCLGILNSLKHEVASIAGSTVYGGWAAAVLSAIVSTSCAAFLIAAAYLCYSPSQSLKWACAMGIVIALPFFIGHLHDSIS